MGLRNSNSIKLIRRGGGAVKSAIPVASTESVIVSAAAPVIFSPVFDVETMKQPLGRTGMINRIYEKKYPQGDAITVLSSDLANRLDLDRVQSTSAHDRTSGYLPSVAVMDQSQFAVFRDSVIKIIDGCRNEPNLSYSSAASGTRGIMGSFGKYKIQLWEGNGKVSLFLHDAKSNYRIGSLVFENSYAPKWAVDDVAMKSKVDAKLLRLLGWSLVQDQDVFRGIIGLMK